jgi:hypothetical protein
LYVLLAIAMNYHYYYGRWFLLLLLLFPNSHSLGLLLLL